MPLVRGRGRLAHIPQSACPAWTVESLEIMASSAPQGYSTLF